MAQGGLTEFDGVVYYAIDGVEHMDPFLMSVVSSTDLWMFASSRGTLTAGRTDADHALLPYETDDRIHRAVGVTGPITIIAREDDGNRELWRPFGADPRSPGPRTVAKSVLGDRLLFEETHEEWGVTIRAVWAPSPEYGWVRTVQLVNLGSDPVTLEVLDGLIDVMPPGVDAVTEQLRSNLVDAYKRSETGSWGTAAIFTLESLITDRAEPAESLSANLIWSVGGTLDQVHIDEHVIPAMVGGRPYSTTLLVAGRRGAYLLRGEVGLDPDESDEWTLVADVDLDHAQLVERVEFAAQPEAVERLRADLAAGSARLAELLSAADGNQKTADPIADAHHLSNVLYNSMRGGLFPMGMRVPMSSFLEHLKTWNRGVHRRFHQDLETLGEVVDIATLRSFSRDSGDPHLVRLTLEYLPLGFSRRHGDPSRPWNRFSIRVRGDNGEEILGYQGNWRDIFQNWEALMFSYPEFLPHAVAKFVNASTADGHNPYRISQDGMDWEVPDPEDPWSNIGYWGDHQVVYLHRLLESWDRFDPEGVGYWLTEPVFTYADVPYRIADHAQMVRDPRNTITYDFEQEDRVNSRVSRMGADGRLVVDSRGQIVRVGLMEKLLVPVLAKLSSFIPGGGIWMNTQRPEWNDANNALAGFGLSMVTLYHLFGYANWLREIVEAQEAHSFSLSSPVAAWLADLTQALEEAPVEDSAEEQGARRALVDTLGAIGSRHRRATAGAYDPTPVSVDAAGIERLLTAGLEHLRHSISLARRPDGLYDSYNLVSFPSARAAEVRKLGPMLEGQVAVLGSGALDARESLDVIDALYESEMYRLDQNSFMLYPVKQLAPFLDRNTVPAGELREAPFLSGLIGICLVQDPAGDLHFSSEMINEAALRSALNDSGLDEDQRDYVLDLYEGVFGHHGYTGRSGSMYGYEGIGSIYWHMVAKLLLAVQETYWRAADGGEPPHLASALAGAYRRVRAGLGFGKDPDTFGAIPTDCYSHTPAHAGAQQPGMTGQVKEEILTRMGELGLRIDEGAITLSPGLLAGIQLLSDPSGIGASFSFCGVPFELVSADEDSVQVQRSGEWMTPMAGHTLDRETSSSIFRRNGEINAVRFSVSAGKGDV